MGQWDTLVRWSPDSRTLIYINHQAGIDNLWAQPVVGGPAKQITNFKEGRIFSFDWLRNGDLVASRGDQNSDVVLINDLAR